MFLLITRKIHVGRIQPPMTPCQFISQHHQHFYESDSNFMLTAELTLCCAPGLVLRCSATCFGSSLSSLSGSSRPTQKVRRGYHRLHCQPQKLYPPVRYTPCPQLGGGREQQWNKVKFKNKTSTL